MKILFIHLLNNYTGSPKVLSQEIKLIQEKDEDYEISLLTSNTEGFLSNINGITYYYNGYKWINNKVLLTFLFFVSQIQMFFFILLHSKFDIIYINTVVPFGAALAAKIKNMKIIYHVHEIYIKYNFIKRVYYKTMEKCSTKIFCVSNYVKENLPCSKEKASVIYNPANNNKLNYDINEYLTKKFEKKIILMPTSLKEYKGINQFIELAQNNTDYTFKLICSVPLKEIQQYFNNRTIPNNILFIGKQSNLLTYYEEAAITINLSLPDKMIETFGLTLVESFDSYTPVIAPNYGGPKEIVDNENNGFLINPYNINEVTQCIRKILNDYNKYKLFAFNAKKSLDKFSFSKFYENIQKELKNL